MEKLDSAQLDQLKEIGAQLRQVRQEQARSLEDIATKTCIRLPLLQAIENGQGQLLPEPVFVQGFIRRYAETLGLDGTSLAHRFPVNRGMVTQQELPIRDAVEPPLPVAAVSTLEEPKQTSREFALAGSSLQSKKAYLLYALLSVLVLGAIIYAFSKADAPPQTATVPSSSNPAAPNPAASPAASSPIAPPAQSDSAASPTPAASSSAASSTPSTAPSNASSSAPNSAPVSASVRLTGEAWMEVTVDGRLDYEGTLPKGTERSWTAKREIILFSGNAGAVSVAANNGAPKPMGRLGDIEELTIKPKN